MRLAEHHVCAEHQPPFEFIADMYFQRYPGGVGCANRTGGKTFAAAAEGTLEVCNRAGNHVLHVGGSLLQAKRGYEYVEKWLRGPLADLVRGDVLQSHTELTNGSVYEIVASSIKAVNGPHLPKLRLDEVELMDPKVFEDALSIPVEQNGWEPTIVITSTRKYASGLMQRILDEAPAKGWRTWQWCLPPGGVVLGADGAPRRIADFGVGDAVLSGAGRDKPVSRVLTRRHDGDMIRFTVQGLCDAIEVTADHRIPTARGWIEARDLEVGDRVIDPCILLEDGGDYRDGWLVGLYIAEGSIFTGPGFGVSFAVHEDEVRFVRQRVDEFLARQGRSRRSRLQCPPGTRCVSVNVFDRGLRALIEAHVDGRSAATKRLADLPTRRDFARGVLDGWLYGDGTAAGHGRIGQTASEALAWQMLRIASSLGYATTITRGVNRPGPGARRRGETTGNPWWRVTVRPERGRSIAETNRWKAERASQLRAGGASISAISRELRAPRDSIRRWLQQGSGRNQPIRAEGCVLRLVTGVEAVPYEGDVCDLTVDGGPLVPRRRRRGIELHLRGDAAVYGPRRSRVARA